VVIRTLSNLPKTSSEKASIGDLVCIVERFTDETHKTPQKMYLGRFLGTTQEHYRVIHILRLDRLKSNKYMASPESDFYFPETCNLQKLDKESVTKLKTLDKYLPNVGFW